MASGSALLEHVTPDCRGSWTYGLGRTRVWACSECGAVHADSAQVRWAVIHEARLCDTIRGVRVHKLITTAVGAAQR